MKNQHSRILAWLLAFSMVLAMMPAMLITASADEPVSAATWAKTDLKDIKSTDTVAITMTRGEVTYALPTTIDAEKQVALALVCTVKGNTLTMSGTDAQYGWHITAAEGSRPIIAGGIIVLIRRLRNRRLKASLALASRPFFSSISCRKMIT